MCQIYTEPWKMDENFERTLEALDEAGRQEAELVITPECVLHGYGFDGVPDYPTAMAEAAVPLDSPYVDTFRARARQHGFDLIVGFAEKGSSGAIHNSAAFISRKGEILSVYRKVHCRDFERADKGGVFTPGGAFEVLEREYRQGRFRIGTMICFDREILESVRCLRALGAELIACPLATNTERAGQWRPYMDNETLTRCRSAENEVFIAVVNHAGRYNGGSILTGPGGEIVHQMGSTPGVHVMAVPAGVISRKFHNNPLGWLGWGYRRPEVYGKYLC
jgi:predicted amidohydrolase